MSKGHHEAADMVEKEMEKYKEMLECAVMKRNFPDRPPAERSPISWNPVPERVDSLQREREE